MPNRIGLIASGAVSQSFLARLPFVRERLGPIYSPALRIASRISNGLRVGYPVSDFGAVARCGIVLIAVPDSTLDATVESAAAADARWTRKSVILCDSTHDTAALAPLQSRGADCASLGVIPASGETRFVAEGDPAAVATLRRLFGRANLLVLEPGGKDAYLAGLLLATDLTLELTARAVDSLRAAGLKRPQAVPIIEALVTQTARSYAKAGRRGAPGLPPRAVLSNYARAIRARDPEVARLFESAVEMQATKRLNSVD